MRRAAVVCRLGVHWVMTRGLCALPRPVAYGLARGLGTALSVVPSKRRTALTQNIAVAHGLPVADPTVRRDMRRAWQHAMLNYVDLFRLARPDTPTFVGSIHVDDWRPYDDAVAQGKGVILVSAHLGNCDTVVQKLALRGSRVLIPIEPIEPPELLELIRRQRAALGMDFVPVSTDTFKRMATHLRTGGTVVIVCDRDIQGTGYPVTFFGHQVSMPQAAIVLAIRTGAAVLGAFGCRHADSSISARFTNGFSFGAERELDTPSSAPDLPAAGTQRRSLKTQLDEGMRQLAALLEEAIRRDPGQWVVQQPVFDGVECSKPATALPRTLCRAAIVLAIVGVVAGGLAWVRGLRT